MNKLTKYVSNIRDYRAIRILVKPIFDWKTKYAHEHYLRSPDCQYLKTLKKIHAGQRCFIIGNGPSLSGADLEHLCNEYTFAANRIYNIFPQTNWRPNYYMSVDDLVIKEIQDQLLDYELGHIFLRSDICRIQASTNKLTRVFTKPLMLDVNRNRYNDTSVYFSEDVSNHFSNGWTVTYAAMELAVYMGFKRIYLLGVDHNYSASRDANGKRHLDDTVQNYFDNKKYASRFDYNYLSVQYAFEIAKEYCDNHGIKVFNATRGGKLEVFERVDFDELMNNIEQEKKNENNRRDSSKI